MKQRLSHRMSLAGAAGIIVLAGSFSGCNSGSDNSSAPAPATGGQTAANTAAPEATPTSERSHTGTAVKPAAGFGNAQGRVLWNEKPAVGVAVQLCEKISFIGGCSGKTYAAKTDSQGNYTVDKVPPGDYSLAVRVFDTDSFVYPTSGIMSAAKFSVKKGETLDIRATNLFKTDLQVTSPRTGETAKTGSPALAWKPYSGATTYEVSLRGATNTEPQNIKTTETKVTPETSLLNGSYTVSVTARNANGVKLAENRDPVPFKVTGQSGSASLTLTAPAAASSIAGSGVKFGWKAHPLAENYQIYLAAAGGGTPLLSFETVEGTSYAMPSPLKTGQYFWSVTAMRGGKKVAASELQNFKVK